MFKISKARNRKGFTLIELMIVIAIIIILAAIAIPNYLRMTERAKKARISSDMASLATGLEAYRTDWGTYPLATAAEEVDDSTNTIYKELGGTQASGTGTNQALNTNIAGETGPIEYIKKETLSSIVDPFKSNPSAANSDGHVYYGSATGGSHWVLYAYTGIGTNIFMWRSDSSSTITEGAAVPSIP